MVAIEEIVKRYNDSVADYASYIVAYHESNEDAMEKHLRDAGEGLSQVIEQAIRGHLEMHDARRASLYSRAPLPRMIEELYYGDDGEQDMYNDCLVEPDKITVDFDYLRNNKHKLTNDSKHRGGKVDPEAVKGYIDHCKRFIKEYFDEGALLRDVDYYMKAPHDKIQQFYVACDHFYKNDRTYILLTKRVNQVDTNYLAPFKNAPWDIIIDFDNRSSDSGFCKQVYRGGEDIPHIYKAGDPITADDFSSTTRLPIYFFANGYKNERTFDDFDEWNKAYYSKMDSFLNAVSKNIVTQKTIVVSLLDDEEFVTNVRNLCFRYFNNLSFIIANDPDDKLYGLANRKKSQYIHVGTTIEEISNCISEYLLASKPQDGQEVKFTIPFLQGEGNGVLLKNELDDIEETFEVLYHGVGDNIDEVSESFLKGEVPLTWSGAKRKFAAERSRFAKMYIKPLEAEIKKGRSRICIVHEPGFGGSTVARQIAYAIHGSYPTLFLKKYNEKAIKEKLERVHDRTKKTLVVFMEIPSVVSYDNFNYLYKTTNQTRPYVFVGIRRGIGTVKDISITDWGNEAVMLKDKFLPYIESRYQGSQRDAKVAEIQSIISEDNDNYKRTPFYFGMLAFEKDFVAAQSFFDKFANAVKGNEEQRKALVYLSICDNYADKSLPEAFFKSVFRVVGNSLFKIEDYFNPEDGVIDTLLQIETEGNSRFYRPKYSYFSKSFLMKLLRKEDSPEDTGWMENLGEYCISLIKDISDSPYAELLQEDILQPLFIGSSKERDGERFTELIDDIQKEERINIFTTLHQCFPDNAHFCSHLARYYAMEEKNLNKAIEFADRAIKLSETPDPLLHHIKGMCIYYIITNKIEEVKRAIKNKMEPTDVEVYDITENLLTQAEREFSQAREIQKESHHLDEYGFIPNIKLLLRVFDFYVFLNKENKQNVIEQAKEPYILWLDRAESLLDDARRLHEEGEESELFMSCEAKLWEQYENYSQIIEKLNNQLSRTSHPTLVRRQLARIYMKRNDDYMTSPKANERILSLMSDNMKTESKNISNFMLWLKAARYSSLETDQILSKLVQLKAVAPAVDLSFYCYVFNAIKAIEGSSEAAQEANNYIKECKEMGGDNNIYKKEWYGEAPQGIISNAALKENPDNYTLYDVTGYVKEYKHSGTAIIEMDCGLKVFFKPSASGLTESCRNHNVRFHLGFSYDGLRADDESVVLI